MHISFSHGYYDVMIGNKVIASFDTYEKAEEFIEMNEDAK